jgi:DUF305 family protein family protein
MVATAAVAGCGAEPATAPAPTAAASVATSAFGGTDLAWIGIDIAMDEQVLPLLDLVPGKTDDAGVRGGVLQVKAFTDAELATLRALHDEAQLPAGNPHEGMPMPAMVTPEQVARASTLSGAAFDTLAVQQIRAHLEQGRNLARSESTAGIESRTRQLAAQVLRIRAAALETLKARPEAYRRNGAPLG